MAGLRFVRVVVFMACCTGTAVYSADWPQLQCTMQKTGRTTDSVLPPYRARWIWFGSTYTVRNRLSVATWTVNAYNLPSETIIGNVAPLPATVPFTFSGTMQPVVAAGMVFVGDMDGKAYGIRADDGSTAWVADLPGGTIGSPAYGNGVVAFGALTRCIRGFNAQTGAVVWEIPTRGPVVAPLVTNGSVVCVGCLDGHVYCINLTDGALLWKSAYLGAQIVGGLAMDANHVYVPVETMYVHKLSLATGESVLSKKVSGQSFYRLWPVVYDNKLFVQAAGIPIVGSEYVGEQVMEGATSVSDEQDRWLQFLQGQGGFTNASPDWKHLTVLSIADFTEPFQVPDGPYEGCGTPPNPPCVASVGGVERLLAYYKTKYVYLCPDGAFGTAYSIDISAMDLTNGRRIPIDNGRRATNEWYTWETDNLYGMTSGGTMLYLRQGFRGTVGINLTTSNATVISTVYKSRDGGTWFPDLCYRNNYDSGERVPDSTHPEVGGRIGPSISGTLLLFTEDFCLTCLERQP